MPLNGISKAAVDLIIAEEVSSQATYSARYQRPERPGGASGITIGIGYDCGYSNAAKIRADWGGRIASDMVDALVRVSGLTGNAAQAQLAWVKPIVSVPWAAAIDVFSNVDMPRWVAIVQAALPNTARLSPDCLGALVSLTYNRGASYAKDGERYAEMRAIKSHMAAQRFGLIPADIRSMKRLWTTPSVRGVALRRDHEADLFQRGLAARSPITFVSSIPDPPPPDVPPVESRPKSSIIDNIFSALFRRK